MDSKVGLVTVTFNSGNVIDGFLHSIANQDYPNFILYIIDNKSTDDTLARIEKAEFSNYKLVANELNRGVAGGNNQGIKMAMEDSCDYIILINNDTEFEPALLSKLVNKSKTSGYSIIVPKMLYYDEPDVIWFAGGLMIKRLGYMCYHVGQDEPDKNQYSDGEITYAPTCCVLFKTKVFEKVGLMDEKYFVYFDDTDFMYRVWKDGEYKMLYINDVKFYHKVGSLTKSRVGTRSNFKFGDFAIKYMTRNRVYYLRKQKSLLAILNIIYFWFRANLRFLFSGKYNITLKKWMLIQNSFFEGLRM